MDDEMPFARHIAKLGRTYQYVRRAPEDLADTFPFSRGQRSLRTSDRATAYEAGARVVGGCRGTKPAHLAAMRHALDAHRRGARPSREAIVAALGPLVAPAAGAGPHRRRLIHDGNP
jgi:hypothetical protein